jgi:hypothetical protein
LGATGAGGGGAAGGGVGNLHRDLEPAQDGSGGGCAGADAAKVSHQYTAAVAAATTFPVDTGAAPPIDPKLVMADSGIR